MRFAISLVIATGMLSVPASAGTLDEIMARDKLVCQVKPTRPGFSYKVENGVWTGFSVDMCRAVAAAVLGDASKVEFVVAEDWKSRFLTVASGDVDIVEDGATWTAVRDAGLHLDFAAVVFYDGQGFMLRRDLKADKLADLAGARICVTPGSTTEQNLRDYSNSNEMVFSYDLHDNSMQRYEDENCDVVSTDRSGLAAFRSGYEKPGDHLILSETISKEPLGMVVRHGDNNWADIVRWSFFALIQAEESGVTSNNAEEMLNSTDPTIMRLLGVSGEIGNQLGLSSDWALQIIRQVGNYGEIYERHLGPNTPINLQRGQNALWNRGGLHYAMPFR